MRFRFLFRTRLERNSNTLLNLLLPQLMHPPRLHASIHSIQNLPYNMRGGRVSLVFLPRYQSSLWSLGVPFRLAPAMKDASTPLQVQLAAASANLTISWLLRCLFSSLNLAQRFWMPNYGRHATQLVSVTGLFGTLATVSCRLGSTWLAGENEVNQFLVTYGLFHP